jgi:hypothetical protein
MDIKAYPSQLKENTMRIGFILTGLAAAVGLTACSDPISPPEEHGAEAAGKLTTSVTRAGGLGKPGFKTVAQLKKIAAESDGGVARWTADRLKKSAEAVVRVPAGSVDALASALASAGPDGVVILESGIHTESATVTISQRVALLGEPGAILQVDTETAEERRSIVDPALYVHNASQVLIWGIDLQPTAETGGVGILLENAPQTLIGHNTISQHQFGILVEQGDHSQIFANTITLGGLGGDGITVINGDKVEVVANDASGGLFGIWICDRNGVLLDNRVRGNVIGIILCKVPANNIPLPSGVATGAELPATAWTVSGNTSTDNQWGYVVIDGANNSTLRHNAASNNARYDMEFVGDSERFGFLTPFSFNNRAIINDPNLVVKDCGTNNKVIGGNQVDISTDPCF